MKRNIETNGNQNDDLIFSEKGKLMDGTEANGSQYYIRIKRSDLDFIDDKQYFALYKQNEKNGKFVLDGTFDPIILSESTIDKEKEKNFLEIWCSDNENIFGLRFCFANGQLKENEAQNASLDNPDLVWLELRCDENGDKFLARYNPHNKTWEPTEISFALKNLFGGNDIDQVGINTVWEMYPKKKYGDGKFLTTFATQDGIEIKTNDNKDNPLAEMKEIVKEDTGLSVDNDDMYIYTCMQFQPNGEFYLAWGPEDITAKRAFKTGLGTINNHNKKMEDVFALRFYVIPEKLNINVGQKFDEAKISNPETCSIFEIRKDENNNMVMWHFDRNNNIWIPVDATVVHKVEYEQTEHKDVHEYKCEFNSNLNSYSVESLWKYRGQKKGPDKKSYVAKIKISTAMQIKRFCRCITRFLRGNKSKIIFSVFVGFLSAVWIGWFAVPSVIILLLILFVIDKFAKCPSVEKWFQCLDRGNNLPPILRQQLQRIQRNEVRGDPIDGLSGRGPFAIDDFLLFLERVRALQPQQQRLEPVPEPEQQGIVSDDEDDIDFDNIDIDFDNIDIDENNINPK